MIVIQLSSSLKDNNYKIVKELRNNTYVLNYNLSDYDIMLDITSRNDIVSTSSNELDVLSSYSTESTSCVCVFAKPLLDEVLEAIDDVLNMPPTVVCFPWQCPRNYIIDNRVQELIEHGHTVVCSGGQDKLPVLDLSPVGADNTLKVGSSDKTGNTNWIDCYDYIVEDQVDSNVAAVYIADKLANNENINIDYRLDFYSDSFIRSASWAKRVVTDDVKNRKLYEFLPVSNLRYLAGEQLLPVKSGDSVSYLYGNCLLSEFVNPDVIDCEAELPRGINFDINTGWLFGTFKYRQPMFHRFQFDINGSQYFEMHIISCDVDNKPSYEECKEKYFNRVYDSPPFSIREYWMPMSKPIKLLEPGDPWVRTYNLNDLHLYRKSL